MTDAYVTKRPGVDEFLEFLSLKIEIVVFTAGLKEYASLVLDAQDRKRGISHRMYRDSRWEMDGNYVKDLSEMGRDSRRVMVVDDKPSLYVFQPENVIPVRPFVDDLGDRVLWLSIEFFDDVVGFEGTRDAVNLFASSRRYLFIYFQNYKLD
ncbi:hypothetical protein Nepgr_007046 [Nepenthes gracilis]|uniref:Mitochondrial import inner membrane translocase subunit TIM50 n=1 Tax=Nepenthes gracilis TaxID=150966 RepID=A0AAD3XI57_NEPGR|nr:hypothetical protein Nepgr_007046 [Nepenthes gracilis]